MVKVSLPIDTATTLSEYETLTPILAKVFLIVSRISPMVLEDKSLKEAALPATAIINRIAVLKRDMLLAVISISTEGVGGSSLTQA